MLELDSGHPRDDDSTGRAKALVVLAVFLVLLLRFLRLVPRHPVQLLEVLEYALLLVELGLLQILLLPVPQALGLLDQLALLLFRERLPLSVLVMRLERLGVEAEKLAVEVLDLHAAIVGHRPPLGLERRRDVLRLPGSQPDGFPALLLPE